MGMSLNHGGQEAYRQEGAVAGGIIDQAHQVAIILLAATRGPGVVHKNELLTEAAAAREPGLGLPCVRVHPGECLPHQHSKVRNLLTDGAWTRAY